jgi:hypothetical protein
VNGGSATIFNNDIVSFDNSSTAGDVTIVNVLPASLIVFRDGATGGNATITSAPALSSVLFLDCSRAGNATINFLGGRSRRYGRLARLARAPRGTQSEPALMESSAPARVRIAAAAILLDSGWGN